MNALVTNDSNSGIRKAAILVSSLDQSIADRVLEQMEPGQAHLVRQAMVELGDIDPKEQRRIIDEFFRVGQRRPKNDPPGIELDGPAVETLRLKTPPSEPEELAPEDGSDGLPFRFLHDAEADKLVTLLTAERPQTIALVLSHLPPRQAGRVLLRFSGPLQAEVICRLVDLEEADPEILRDVERTLQSRLSEQFGIQRRRVAGLSAVAEILQSAGHQQAVQILTNLASHDRQLAEKLGPRPLEFDELARLDDGTLSTVLKAAGRELISLALVGAAPEVTDRFLVRLGASEAESIRRELEHPGPTRLSDVQEARRRIGQLTRRLALEGRISLPRRTQPTSTVFERLRSAA